MPPETSPPPAPTTSPHDDRADERDSQAILAYWFSTLDDDSPLDPKAEPFRSRYARWYGKDAAIDAEIKERFEPALRRVTGDGVRWEQEIASWARAPDGLLALVILLDQLPRNMYRGSAAMYAHDPLALSVAAIAIREYESAPLSLVRRMFLYVPLMHAENLTLQQAMLRRFEGLARLSATQSPKNKEFFASACGYARRHVEVIQTFGRFPHRNAILGRRSTPEEETYLERDDAGF